MLKILKHWEIGSVIDDVYQKQAAPNNWRIKVIETSKRKYLLKKINLQERNILFIESKLLSFLNSNDIPVNFLVKTIDGSNYYQDGSIAYCLYHYVEGSTFSIKQNSDYMHLVAKIGLLLGKLHNALRVVPFLDDIKDQTVDQVSNLTNLTNRIEITLQENEGLFDGPQILKNIELLENEFITLERDLPKQLIHRDYHPENIIIINREIAALIDFDLLYFEVKIFDVCYFCSSLLSEFFDKISTMEEQWFEITKMFIENYTQVNTITEVEKNAFFNILAQIQMLFLLFFIRHGNFVRAKETEQMFFWLLKRKDKIIELLQ